MDLLKLLASFDLSETESKVYLSALKGGHKTAGEIAKLAEVKRSTVYHVLGALMDKGLIATTGTKVERFIAQPPEQLSVLLERKTAEIEQLQQALEKALPFFPQDKERKSTVPFIEYFHGPDGLKSLVEKMLRSRSKIIYTFGAPFHMMESPDNNYMAHFLQERAKRGIKTMSIWQDTPKNAALLDNVKLLRDVRMGPQETRDTGKTMISIVDDVVIVLNFQPELFGFAVKSAGFSETMKGIWDVTWRQSTEIAD